MDIETGVEVDNKCFFLTNLALICGTMMVSFVLDAIPVNATVWSSLSNAIVDEHKELLSGVLLRSMDDCSC